MRLIVSTVATLFVAGCASQPAAPTTASTATPVTAKPAAAAPAATTAAQGSTSTPAKYPGYKAKQRNGTTVYCKKVAKLGTRFEEETCMTDAEMKTLMQQAESDRDAFRRNGTQCGTGGCGGG
jgi:PBP1b-binding outer membrane lipoprotein LpoB